MKKNILSFIVGTILLVSLNACGQKESIERITASATWDTYYENIQEIVTTQTRNWETQEYKYNGYITSKAKSVTTYIMTNPVIEG